MGYRRFGRGFAASGFGGADGAALAGLGAGAGVVWAGCVWAGAVWAGVVAGGTAGGGGVPGMGCDAAGAGEVGWVGDIGACAHAVAVAASNAAAATPLSNGFMT